MDAKKLYKMQGRQKDENRKKKIKKHGGENQDGDTCCLPQSH